MSSLRDALETAFAEEEQPTQEVQAEPVEVSEQETIRAERARDESGRFAPKFEKPAEPVQTAPVEAAPVAEPAPIRKAPSSWKPAAQEAFLKADRGEVLTQEEIRMLASEAERREGDFHKGVEAFKTHAQRAREYDQAFAPYQQHLQSLGVDAPTAIQKLMQADYTLRRSDPATKAQYFAQLAQEYGIDLNMAQQVPQVDPQTQYLTQQLNELRQRQMHWETQLQQQEQMKAQHELSSFATAERAHFEAVRNDMADLLETGKAKSLQDAYDMAVWMRPDIRQSLLEQQRADAERKARDEAQAQRAKTANVSVKGSSPAAGGGQPIKGSLRDVIAAQFAEN